MKEKCVVSFVGDTHPPVELPAGSNLSEHLTVQNSPVLFGCRTGICATCLCRVEGDVAPPDDEEQDTLDVMARNDKKARLLCQLKLTDDIVIEVPK